MELGGIVSIKRINGHVNTFVLKGDPAVRLLQEWIVPARNHSPGGASLE